MRREGFSVRLATEYEARLGKLATPECLQARMGAAKWYCLGKLDETDYVIITGYNLAMQLREIAEVLLVEERGNE